MRTAFESLSEESKIWVFQSSKAIDESTAHNILTETDTFLHQWAAHGADLLASATIEFNRFLIIGIDQEFNMASGCSIDSMVRFVQGIEQKYNLGLFDRTKLVFKKQNQLEICEMNEMKNLVAENFFDSETLYFNNNIDKKGQLKTDWLVNPEETWLKKYFQTAKSV